MRLRGVGEGVGVVDRDAELALDRLGAIYLLELEDLRSAELASDDRLQRLTSTR